MTGLKVAMLFGAVPGLVRTVLLAGRAAAYVRIPLHEVGGARGPQCKCGVHWECWEAQQAACHVCSLRLRGACCWCTGRCVWWCFHDGGDLGFGFDFGFGAGFVLAPLPFAAAGFSGALLGPFSGFSAGVFQKRCFIFYNEFGHSALPGLAPCGSGSPGDLCGALETLCGGLRTSKLVNIYKR